MIASIFFMRRETPRPPGSASPTLRPVGRGGRTVAGGAQ
jgi:hypothetical protein